MSFEVVISPVTRQGKVMQIRTSLLAVVDEPDVEPEAEDARAADGEGAVSEKPEAEVDVVGEIPDGSREEEVGAPPRRVPPSCAWAGRGEAAASMPRRARRMGRRIMRSVG